MSTEKQILANRANARKSTGPRTELGKAAASRNRTLHGFATGDFILFNDEDRDQYHDLLESLRAEHQPATETEDLLVIKLLQHHWLQQRAIGYQTQAFDEELVVWHERKLNLYLRYATQHERAFNKVLVQLKDLQKQRCDEARNTGPVQVLLQRAKNQILLAQAEIFSDKAEQATERRAQRAQAKAASTSESTTSQEIGFEPKNHPNRTYPIRNNPQKSTPEGQPNAA